MNLNSQSIYGSEPPPSHNFSYFYSSGRMSCSATSTDPFSTSTKYDLITLLAAAQWRQVDLLPITWQPELDPIGRGATAEIRQSLINISLSFAFKRFVTSTEACRIYKALISEICILGHPVIREHPNIITLEGICWDVVAQDEVWPVLVFERTKHGNLSTFMSSEEGRALTATERLDLGVGIVGAVMDMHSCGVIHGDLKPENILVFNDDVCGYRAKLCDFGYSALGSEGAYIQLPSTYPWAAPEHHHRDVSIPDAKKEDVYSLGLVLLWLIFSRTVEERIVTVVETDGASKFAAEENVFKSNYYWLETLRDNGDLQPFVTTCLSLTSEFAPGQRQEIGLFLENALSVDADARTLYRLGALSYESNNNITDASSEMQNLNTHLEKSFFQISYSLEQLVEAHLSVRRCIASCLESWTNVATSKLPEILRRKANFQLAICHEVGFGVRRAPERAGFFLEKAEDSYESTRETYAIQLGTLRDSKGWSYRNLHLQSIAEQGFFRGMEYVFEYRKLMGTKEVADIYVREIQDFLMVFRKTHFAVFSLRMQLFHVLRSMGELAGAQDLLVEITQDFENDLEYSPSGIELESAREALALLSKDRGNYAFAKSLLDQILKQRETSLGNSHPFTLSAKNNLATIYKNDDNLEQAELLLKEAWAIAMAAFSSEHPESTKVAGNLASVLHAQNKMEAAEDMGVQVYNALSKTLGASHPNTLASASNLASIYRSRGNLEAAEKLFGQIVQAKEEHFGVLDISTLTSLNNLAMVHKDLGRLDLAEQMLQRTVSGREATLGREHPDTQTSLSNLAGIFLRRNDNASAESYYREVLKNSQNTFGEGHSLTITAATNLAVALHKQHQTAEAEKAYLWAHDLTAKQFGQEHPRTLLLMSNIAGVLYSQGKLEEAENTYLKLLHMRTEALGPNHLDTIKTEDNLSGVLVDQGRFEEAESLIRKALETKQKLFDREHPLVLKSVHNLANVLQIRSDFVEAESMAMWAFEGRRKLLGPSNPDTMSSHMILVWARRAKSARVLGKGFNLDENQGHRSAGGQ